jgi:hypothetical protein
MSDTSVSPLLRGGLGNYIFQIAAAYYISLRDNKKMIVDISDISVIHNPIESYYNNIFRKIKFVNEFTDYKSHEPMQPIQYSEIPNTSTNLKLKGYYQNEKYFKHLRKNILELFEIDSETLELLNTKYSNLLSEKTCSLHVRRGDYVAKSDFHTLQSIDYYKTAISIIGEEYHYLIFSDDTEWCKENLNFIKNKTFISGNLDYQDLYLMSMCENNIIANSSFSWWGAWLNDNKNKKVIYPSNWFGVPFLDTSEIGCENWIKI